MIKQLTTNTSAGMRRLSMLIAIALGAWLIAWLFTLVASAPARWTNDFFYDVIYRTRPPHDMTGKNGDVVLVVADQASLTAVDQRFKKGWPWPREFWGYIATYLDKAGAKAIVFDLQFIETSVYAANGDDDLFADAINALKTPVVFGAEVRLKDGKPAWQPFSPPVKNPIFGAVNIGNSKMFRSYEPMVEGYPALATRAVMAAGDTPPAFASAPFLLHYYGPHQRPDKQTTFPYIHAASVMGAQIDPGKAESYGITPDLFKGKIVVLGGSAAGTFDLKSSPLSDEYPGPEVHATAIENMLRGQRVIPISAAWVAGLSLALAGLVTLGVILPRKALFKLLIPVLCIVMLFAVVIGLFQGNTIRWLPPLEPLLSMVIATPVAFAWTYFAEDRQRRFMMKALSKVVSPTVAEQLAREPERLARATVRTDLTILFSDLAGFTDLSEGLDVQQLGDFMNRYLGAMSDQVLSQDGTLDKYIGDAVMAFWNAPLSQQDHAARACAAALRMVAREKELFAEMAVPGAKTTFTRIGINTATVAVGFIGSEHLFNYTCLGDGVNLASRLEGANKLYGSRILISANTAALVQDKFWLRQVDVLRVKGKKEPMAVFELLAAKGTDDQRYGELTSSFAQAFAAYQRRDWHTAEKLLLELSRRFGQDGPAEALLHRVQEYNAHPPDPAWDGVYVSKSK